MNKVSTMEHEPTFLLRGISHAELLDSYYKGEFSSVSRLNTNDFDMVGTNIVNDNSDPNTSYSIKTRSNHTMKVLMPAGLQIQRSDGKSLQPGGLCDWTREMISGLPVILPIDSWFNPITKETLYVGVGEFFNFECAYAYHKKYKVGSLVLLRNLFKLLYPDDELNSAKDYALHKNFGGPLTSERYHASNHVYHKVSGVRILLSQIQYIEGCI